MAMRAATILCSALLLIGFSAAAQGADHNADFTVKVSGDPGVKFSGFYRISDVDSIETRKGIGGTVPAAYSLSGSLIECTVNNVTPGALKVEILQGNTVLEFEEKGSSDGDVSITATWEF
jgi:hypothetical protein